MYVEKVDNGKAAKSGAKFRGSQCSWTESAVRNTEMWLPCVVDSGESVASSGLCSRRQNGWWYMAMYTEDGPPLQARANKKTLVKEKKSARKWCLIETVQEGSSSGQWLPGVHTHASGGGSGSKRREVMIK